MATPNERPTFTVVARAPFHVYYTGPALSLSAKNRVGAFDILPGHADFFSMLSPCTVTIETPDDTVQFSIDNGLLTVRDDDVHLFVNM